MRTLKQFWSVRRIGEDRVTMARLGPMRLWLARADREWGFACHYGDRTDLMDFAQVPEDVVPENLEWTHILFGEAPRDFGFEAVTPREPVSVRIAGKTGIPKGESAKFHLVTPVFIRIRVLSENQSRTLGILPSERITRSWFGSPVEGVLTSSNRLDLAMEMDPVDANPHQIVYPVEIRNSSDQMLGCDRLCLNLKSTGLYSGTKHLWGTPVRIEYFGMERECLISYPDTVPGEEEGLMEVAAPHRSEKRELSRLAISGCHPV